MILRLQEGLIVAEKRYYLNKPNVSKRYYGSFVDTGMGADAYSVIELKMIEQIFLRKQMIVEICSKKQLEYTNIELVKIDT